MIETKRLAARAALIMAAAALVGVSAFAESRPDNETRVRRDADGAIRRERAVAPSERGRRNETHNGETARERAPRASGSSIDVRGRQPREERDEARRGDRAERPRAEMWRERPQGDREDRSSRGRDETYRGEGRSSRGRNDDYRNDDYRGNRSSRGHNDSYRGRESRSHHRGQPHYAHGRVSRVHRHGNGYRVWIHGSRYPFFIPAAHYHHDRFRVGLMIRLGGWYNDAGYYDYYDGRSSAELYGVVESVDYRRNSFVVRNEATGSFVTVIARDREADRLRAGDFVELYGVWTRSGLFRARDVDLIDSY